MKELLRIFRCDIGEITKHGAVLLVVIGIIILPSLYAWINIYASYDPYVNTKNIPVAVASNDAGIKLSDGTYTNAGEEVCAMLKDDETVKWERLQSAEEAIQGVRAGQYYAAVIFEDNFSYNMRHLRAALLSQDPSITYYTNTKKNAIASKITDSAADSLQEKINTKYLEAVFDDVFKDTNKLSDELDSEDQTAAALRQLKETRDSIADLNTAVSLMMSSKKDVNNSLNKAEKTLDKARSRGSSNIEKAEESISEAKKAVKKLKSSLNKSLSKLDAATAELGIAIDALISATDDAAIQENAAQVKAKAETVLGILKDTRALIPSQSSSASARVVADTIDLMILQTEEIIALIDEDPVANAKAIAEAADTLTNVQTGDLAPGVESLISDFNHALKIAKPLLSATDGMLDDIDPVLNAAGGTVDSLDVTNARLQAVMTTLQEDLDDIIAQVEAADKRDQAGLLKNLMNADPDKYSKFFSSLVHVKKHEVYMVRSYGAAMSPFYSILAIWVGGVILVGLLTTKTNRRRFPQITDTQSYFGRSLIFLLIGQLQAAVIVLGDIFLLHCDPVHPWLMWIAAAVTSLVFVMLIYSLVYSFGIVGKAAVVIIMVLQIAGSSGSYPIEILPEIFGKIYKFFPFPYAINAMREGLCGAYGSDFLIYLAELLVFGVLALVIGLIIRQPFVGVNRYVTEKLEETEVL